MTRTRTLATLILAAGLALPVLAAAAGNAADDAPRAERPAAGGRPEADRARDASRRPAEVLAFLGIGPGMTVMDLIAAGGWYTEVLAEAVGPEGTVYTQNPPRVLAFREGAYDRELTERLAGGRLPNVVRLDRELAEVDLPPGSLDAALTAQNVHDVYGEGGPQGEKALRDFLRRVRALLEPGGVLGVIDHAAVPGTHDASLHRIDEATVVAAARDAGLEVAARSDLLRNPGDDRTRRVFDPAVRGRTDRFLLKLRRPQEGTSAPQGVR